MRLGVLRPFARALACACLLPIPARAVGTRVFELDSLEKLSGGELQGVAVGSDGIVRAGWTLSNLALPPDAGTTAACALALPDGSVLIGTGPSSGGKVVRVANDQATVLAWEAAERFPTKVHVDRMNELRAKGPGAVPKKAKAGGDPVKSLADPQVWELLRKIAAHKKLRDEVAKLAERYPDPASE